MAAIIVNSGGDLQAALNFAAPGDSIVLQSGAVFSGNFSFPKKTGDDWITITSSDASGSPEPDTRVAPADAVRFAKLISPNVGAVLSAEPGAHHYRITRLEIAASRYGYDTIVIGDGAANTTLADLPHDIELDRLYIHGDAKAGVKRGVATNGAHLTVKNCYISDIKGLGQDTQAVGGWNTPGPIDIINNYLEASGENVMFGGAASGIPGVIPSDIRILRNHIFKPLSWRADDPSYAGTPWLVKNLLEIKNAQRVLIEGNILENSWVNGQVGWAIVLTPRVQGGTIGVALDITIRNNIIRHVANGITLVGHDNYDRARSRGENFIIDNNLIYDVTTSLGARAFLFMFQDDAKNITITHNTAINDNYSETAMIESGGAPCSGFFAYKNNISPLFGYGFFASVDGPPATMSGMGTDAIQRTFPGGWTFLRNVLPGHLDPATQQQKYPPYPDGNFYPVGLDDVKWIDAPNGNWKLSDSSPFKGKGDDGKDPGVDMAQLLAATEGVLIGRPAKQSSVPPAILDASTRALLDTALTQLAKTEALLRGALGQ